MTRHIFYTLFFLLFAATPAFAAATIGEKIPHALNLQDQNGEQQNLTSMRGEKGIALAFVRSAEWCPFCQKQLIDLQKSQKDIQDLGYNVVSISYDAIDVLAHFSEKHGTTYTMLSDKDSAAIKAFGILNTDMQEGTRYYGIPHPAIYIIGKDGVIHAKLAEEGYKNRPSHAAIIDAIKNIPAP